MSNELLDTLENKVFSAVDTIETLRAENSQLKEERKILEDKLQDLISRMSGLESSSSNENTMEDNNSNGSGNGIQEETPSMGESTNSFRNPYSEY